MKLFPIVITILLALGVGLPAGAAVTPTTIEGATIVDPAAAKALLDEGAKFVDVRGTKSFEKGRIPGAVLLDLFDGFNEENLGKIIKKNEKVVIYYGGPG
jgi:rhodanese-related sulfurtransferase